MAHEILSRNVMLALGLTGVVGSAVSCGPCLSLAYEGDTSEDTGDEPDTGDGGDSGGGEDTGAPTQQTASHSMATDRVQARKNLLRRNVLPSDVQQAIESE